MEPKGSQRLQFELRDLGYEQDLFIWASRSRESCTCLREYSARRA